MAETERVWLLYTGARDSHEGPYTQTELSGWLSSGHVSPEAFVWRNGLAAWLRIGHTPEFTGAPSPAAQAPNPADVVAVTEAGAAPVAVADVHCVNHPARSASWKCPSCNDNFCEDCVASTALRGIDTTTCVKCEGRICAWIGEDRSVTQHSFFKMLPDVFSYPFRKGGWIMLVIGVFFFGAIKIAGAMGGPWGVVVSCFGSAFMLSFTFKIIYSSAQGKDEMPDWPKLNNSDLVWPLMPMFMASMLTVGIPVFLVILGTLICPLLAMFVSPFFMLPGLPFLIAGVILLPIGAFFLPMATLSAALGGQVHMHPVENFGAIRKVFKVYVTAVAVLFCIGIFSTVFGLIGGLIGFLVNGFVSLYLAVVEARILGLIYLTKGHLLEWEGVDLS